MPIRAPRPADHDSLDPPVPLTAQEISWVRSRLAAGEHLSDLAEDLGVLTRDLDAALWRRIGTEPVELEGFQPIGSYVARIMDHIGYGKPIPAELLQRKRRAA